MDGRDEILIPPAIEENSPVVATRPLNENNLPPTIKGVQDYGSPHALARGDPNTDFLNTLFNSSYEPQFPMNSLDHQQILRQIEEGDFQSPLLHSVASNESIPHPDVAYQAATRTQSLWPGGSRRTDPANFWHRIAFGSSKNIYDTYESGLGLSPNSPSRTDEIIPEITLTDSCKRRLKGLKRNILGCGCNHIFDDGFPCECRYICINTTEVFDQGFYLYTHKYQPAYPVLHLATHNPDNTPELLLFVMCMIGISFLKTEEAAAFVRTTYPVRKISQSAKP